MRRGQVETSLWHVLAVKSHPTPEYAWEGVELALSSTNAIEHLSLPSDPASRRLFGVPIVATVSQAAGVGHVLARDAVVVDTDTIGVGVQWSETSSADDFSKNLIRALCEGLFRDQRPQPAGRRLLRLDGLETPVGWLSSSRFSATSPEPNPRSRSFARICAIGESARDRGTGRRETTAAVAPEIKIRACPM